MPAFESLNTFGGGMKSDSSKFFQSPDTYLEALNFRVITDNGQSNHALVNIKGNEYKTTLNNTFPVYKVQPNVVGTSVVPCTITINGVVSTPVNVNSGTLGYDIYSALLSMSNYGVDFYASYYEESCVIWSQTLDPNPSLSSAGLKFITQFGLPNNWYVAPQNDLIPIGSTYIRDDIYVFTTPSASNPSGPNTLTSGQIWKLEYDKINLVATLTLLYNNYVNFSTSHPIPPTATQGRYESDTIQRLYWTDDYNPLRSCNIKDPQLMSFPVGLLNIFPIVQPFIPTLDRIEQTGSLKTGVYQFAYRLRKSNSQVTLWSTLSLPIPIYNNQTEAAYTNGGPAGAWQAYIGLSAGVNNTNKSIVASIKKVDSNYDFVDLVVCKRYSYNDPGTFEIFSTAQPIVPNQPLTFTYRGTETVTTLTLNEFLLTSPGFTHCKTIETKDNRLFAGNVRVEKSDLIYDARAYQYPSLASGLGTNTQLTHNNISNTYAQSLLDTPFGIPETHDAINTDYTKTDPNNANPALRPTNGQRFYPGTNTPGGKGPNVSFTFGAFGVKIDEVPNVDFGATPDKTPWRHTNQLYNTYLFNPLNLGVDKEDYPFNNINDSFKTAYKSFVLRSYQPNEIYRFGIQFYDKQGSPYFAKWVCDIRMPDYSDACINQPLADSDVHLNKNFNLCEGALDANGNIKYYMKPLYLNFTVDVSTIIDKISGFEIVRVERTKEDRIIAGTGYMYQTQYENSVTPAKICLPNTLEQSWYSAPEPTNKTTAMYIDNPAYQAGGYYNKAYTLDCWDWQYEGYPGLDATNDRLVTKGAAVTSIASTIGYVLAGAGTYNYGYWPGKFYSWNGGVNFDELKIDYAAHVGQGSTYALQGSGYTYQNFTTTAGGYKLRSIGMETTIVELNSGYGYDQYRSAHSLGLDPYKIYFEYRKYGRLVTQYGGRTYADRANSEYISCGMYVPVDDTSIVNNSGVITFGVFGGDSFYNVLDNQKGDKDWNNASGGNDIESYIHYKPAIHYHNSDMRYGKHFESNQGGQVNSINWTVRTGDGEDFGYDNTYSIENNIRKFFPKPLLINTTDNWDNRVYYSEVKINGEVQDSWENFKTNNFWDVEGSYGPINSLIAFTDKLYFIQKKAFGWLLVNLQSLTTTTNGATLSLGKGDVIGRHDYISTDVGTNHQWSVSRSPSSILFVDVSTKKVYKYGGQGLVPISDLYEQRGTFVRLLHDDVLVNDNPILNSGILCAYDFYMDEYLITILNKYTRTILNDTVTTQEYNTISFNEKIDRWNSFYSFTPNIYIFNRTQLWSNNPLVNNDLYIHDVGDYGKFYGTIYPSTVKLLSNHNGKFTKLFNNFLFNTEVIDEGSTNSIYDDINIADDTFDTFRAYNDYQNTDFITLDPSANPPTVRRVERQWNLQCPRNKVLYTTGSPNIFTNLGTKLYGERMRDKYLTIDLSYDNADSYKLIFSNFITKYLVSDR